jgi:hypothetical protein
MYEEYVCKMRLSTTQAFTNPHEATAFGFLDEHGQRILTAGHAVTNILGSYPNQNTVQLYVEFENYLGVLNQNPILVTFELHDCNNSHNFSSPSPFVDLAEVKVDAIQPVTKFFSRIEARNGDTVLGLGYPLGSSTLTLMNGVISTHPSQPCTKHLGNGCGSSRFVVNHNSSPGCSGGPYIKLVDEVPYVVGSLIGLIQPNVPANALQSANDF